MTILPKKKQQKDKNESENRDAPRSPPGDTRLGHVSRRQGNASPTRWNNASQIDVDLNIDPGGRFEDVHTHELNQNHKKRHRSSPHRTSRKHRHCSHQTHADRQSSRQDRQNTLPLWVDPTPGTSHANLSPLSHTTHLAYTGSSQDPEGGYNSEDEYSSSTQPVIPQLGENINSQEVCDISVMFI